MALRVLIVEDDADAAAGLDRLLRGYGFEVHLAYDGVEALEAALTCEPDVVLLDLGLPRLDGYEVAKELHRRSTSKRPFLIAVTGHGGEDDRRRSRLAGIDMHL